MSNLAADIAAFCQSHGIAETTFGRLAVNDPRLCRDLAAGRTLRAKGEQKVRDFMANYQPENADV